MPADNRAFAPSPQHGVQRTRAASVYARADRQTCDLDEPTCRALLERRAAWRRLRRPALDECLALAPAAQTMPGAVVDLSARARARRCA